MFALEKIGLYNHGFIIDTAITLVAIYLSRRIFKDVARALNDEPGNETSLSDVIHTIDYVVNEWKA
jgi:hypothetical protein